MPMVCDHSAVPAAPTANAKVLVNEIFSDEAILALNKVAGMVTQPGIGHLNDSLMNGIFTKERVALTRLGTERDYGLLHRLDRETSGVILVARTADAYDKIRGQFEARTIEKTYLAIVRGRLPSVEGCCRQSLSEVRRGDMKISVPSPRGETAVTHWRVLASTKEMAVVACAIETGKLHQIRSHMAYLGAPVEGDRVYRSLLPPNTSALPANQRHLPPTLRLHAWRIALTHPTTGKRIEIEAPIPKNILELIGQCLSSQGTKGLPTTQSMQRITSQIQGENWWIKSKVKAK